MERTTILRHYRRASKLVWFVLVSSWACRVSAFHQSALGKRLCSRNHALSSTPGAGDFGELTSALARLDQQWQIQQRSNPNPETPKWSKLVLPKEEEEEEEEDREQQQQQLMPRADDFVWMLEPPNNSIPSCVIVFTGGAGLGQFPQVAYNELLLELSKNLNALCLTVPYEVGLDHFSLAKQTGEKLRRALLLVDERRESEGQQALRKYSLAHSLGCKLQTIYLAATGIATNFDGVGYLALNNFSFAKTIGMARAFAQELRGGSTNVNVNPEVINSLFEFAEMAVGAVGLEFSPTPGDTQRLIQLRYNPELQAKTRVFKFQTDQLDSSDDFLSALVPNSESISVSNLPGGHLTPVFFQFNADDLAKEAMGGFADAVSQENLNMAKEAMGGFQGASFGDPEAFQALVQEVENWILGKPPTQPVRPQISSSSNGNE